MKISVVTPSYNQAEFLEQTIKSVVSQDYPHWEYLIMDGGSADNSVDIIKKFAEKYPGKIIWRSHRDKGQVAAINEGLRLATGQIIAYLNSDDYYLPGAFAQAVGGFKSYSDRVWLTGSCRIENPISKTGGWLNQEYVRFWIKRYSYPLHLVINCVAQPATFWKRKCLPEVGYFNGQYQFAFDYDYWLRLGRISLPIVVEKYLATFRVHPGSKGFNYFRYQFKEEMDIAKKYSNSWLLLTLHFMHVHGLVLPGYIWQRGLKERCE